MLPLALSPPQVFRHSPDVAKWVCVLVGPLGPLGFHSVSKRSGPLNAGEPSLPPFALSPVRGDAMVATGVNPWDAIDLIPRKPQRGGTRILKSRAERES